MNAKPRAAKSPKLTLTIRADLGKPHLAQLKKYLPRAHKLLNPALQDFSLALVNDQTMSDLHIQFMNIPGPTDVLTFPMDFDADQNCISGEVIVCVPEAARRAKEIGHSTSDEVLLYALHGMLHLCGFDDRTKSDFKIMHATEDRILTSLGLKRLFAPESKPQVSKKGAR